MKHRAPADWVKNLRSLRPHPGSMAGRHDEHGGARRHVAERSGAYAEGALGGWCNWRAREPLKLEEQVRSLSPQLGSVPTRWEHVCVAALYRSRGVGRDLERRLLDRGIATPRHAG